jgi:hypothetical protein
MKPIFSFIDASSLSSRFLKKYAGKLIYNSPKNLSFFCLANSSAGINRHKKDLIPIFQFPVQIVDRIRSFPLIDEIDMGVKTLSLAVKNNFAKGGTLRAQPAE